MCFFYLKPKSVIRQQYVHYYYGIVWCCLRDKTTLLSLLSLLMCL